ncbi:MAG: hypothetical protein K2M97_03105, partial [Muribaculaceae bacterium]|nr:hypothetical protein [Muribaculaceae bacterium]
MKRYIKYIVAILLFAVIFCCYYFQGAHLLYFFEQHYLFRWTTDYWATMAHLRGWTYPIESFIVQFSYYPALGAAVWALLLTLEYLMLQSIIYRLSGYRDLLQVTALVPMWLFSTTLSVDAPPTAPVQWLVWTFVVWVVAMAVGRFLPWTRRSKTVDHGPVESESDDGVGKKESKKSRGSMWLWASPALALLFMGMSYSLWCKEPLTNDIAEAERTMLLTERAVRERRWDDALQLTNNWAATGRKNHMMSYFRSLALYHT